MASGFVLGNQTDFRIIALLLWCDVLGVFVVYRLNDCVDQHISLKFSIKECLSFKIHKWALLQFVFIIPLALFLFSKFIFIILSISAIVGTAYSLSVTISGKQYRLKNMFFIKNLLIGLIWGSLVLIGAGGIENPAVIALFAFASAQVFIGSIVRDIPDIKKDKSHEVQSFPVVKGIPWTINFIRLVNLISFSAVLLADFNRTLVFIFSIVIFWRAINIYKLGKDNYNPKWSQLINLLTCVLIFLVTLLSSVYESF